MHLRVLLLSSALATSMCRRSSAPVTDDDAAVEPDALAPGAPVVARVRCRAGGVRWAVAPGAGERFDEASGAVLGDRDGDVLVPAIESATVLRAEGEAPMVFTHALRNTLTLARGATMAGTVSLGGGNRSEAVAVMAGALPVVVVTHDAVAGRRHAVFAGDELRAVCEQPEARDETLTVSAAASARGVLIAWDEQRPEAPTSAVMVQFVTPTQRGGTCPAPRRVTPPDQDAEDPLVVSTPDGGAVILWLAAREVERDQGNDTSTDVWAQSLDAAGLSRGPAVRVTGAAGHRFGVAASASPDGRSVWVAWRVVPESGTEARGDGGSIALGRLTRNGQGVARAGDPVVMTGPHANPMGTLRVYAHGLATRPAEVWWRERVEGSVVTVHRAVDMTGAPEAGTEGVREPAFGGELPAWVDAQGRGARVLRSPGGAVGVMQVRCDAR